MPSRATGRVGQEVFQISWIGSGRVGRCWNIVRGVGWVQNLMRRVGSGRSGKFSSIVGRNRFKHLENSRVGSGRGMSRDRRVSRGPGLATFSTVRKQLLSASVSMSFKNIGMSCQSPSVDRALALGKLAVQ